jgi:predicted kinase
VDERRPALIVVTGRPASGKTTLAHTLAREIRCPAVCRDEVKEGLIHTTGEAGGDAALRANAAFFETVTLLLRHGVTLVAEAAFQHKLWAPRLEPLREFADLRLIVCAPAPEVARARFAARGLADPDRERFHPGAPAAEYDPPRLDAVPTLTVDTADGYRPSWEEIVAFAQGCPFTRAASNAK